MKYLLSLTILVTINFTLLSQEKSKWSGLDASPMDMATYPSEAAYTNYIDADDPNRLPKIKVIYSRPYKKDRVIFGDLVPYGADWRLGANEGTEVTFYQNVEIGNVTIPRGRYRLYAEINKGQWEIVISSYLFTAGIKDMDREKELGRFTAKTSEIGSVQEQFTIGFQKVNEGQVNLLFEWDKTRATLPINLYAPSMASNDSSPMDMAWYPSNARFQNFLKADQLEANKPKMRIIYSRPQKKEREIFGELLEYGDMWRLGANETTTLTLYTDATIGDVDILREVLMVYSLKSTKITGRL